VVDEGLVHAIHEQGAQQGSGQPPEPLAVVEARTPVVGRVEPEVVDRAQQEGQQLPRGPGQAAGGIPHGDARPVAAAERRDVHADAASGSGAPIDPGHQRIPVRIGLEVGQHPPDLGGRGRDHGRGVVSLHRPAGRGLPAGRSVKGSAVSLACPARRATAAATPPSSSCRAWKSGSR
jgi:hypothetical protein